MEHTGLHRVANRNHLKDTQSFRELKCFFSCFEAPGLRQVGGPLV